MICFSKNALGEILALKYNQPLTMPTSGTVCIVGKLFGNDLENIMRLDTQKCLFFTLFSLNGFIFQIDFFLKINGK